MSLYGASSGCELFSRCRSKYGDSQRKFPNLLRIWRNTTLFTQSTSEHCCVILILLHCKFTVISLLNYSEDMTLIFPTLQKFDTRLKWNVMETHRLISNWTNSKVTGKSKLVRAPSLVETFPNIKQQFEIDVDATRTVSISKNILLFVFQFLEKMFFNTMLERVFDNFKHVVSCSKLLVLNRIH